MSAPIRTCVTDTYATATYATAGGHTAMAAWDHRKHVEGWGCRGCGVGEHDHPSGGNEPGARAREAASAHAATCQVHEPGRELRNVPAVPATFCYPTAGGALVTVAYSAPLTWSWHCWSRCGAGGYRHAEGFTGESFDAETWVRATASEHAATCRAQSKPGERSA